MMSNTLAQEEKIPSRLSSVLDSRLLGIFPLIFFLLQVIHYWNIQQLGHLLWMCNIGNLLLGLGLLLNEATLKRVAILWTIPGLIIWIIFVVFPWGVFFSSTLAHVGGTLIAMLVLKRTGLDRKTWLYAFLWFLLIQGICRIATAPELNVNLAHRMQDRFETVFGNYWEFLVTLDLVTGVVLWGLGLLLTKMAPVTDGRVNAA